MEPSLRVGSFHSHIPLPWFLGKDPSTKINWMPWQGGANPHFKPLSSSCLFQPLPASKMRHSLQTLTMAPLRKQQPGDSIRDLFIPYSWRSLYHLKGSRFHHPKRVTESQNCQGSRCILPRYTLDTHCSSGRIAAILTAIRGLWESTKNPTWFRRSIEVH